jgi:hypothetical protein
MPTYQWVYANPSYPPANPYPGTGNFYSCPPITLPVGAQMKRFLVRTANIQGVSTGNGYNNSGIWSVNWRVHFTAGAYGARDLFLSYRRIPAERVAVYDVAATERIYTSYLHAGDNEIGFNQKAIFGKAGGAANTIVCDCGVNMLAPGMTAGITNWYFSYQFGVLYYL